MKIKYSKLNLLVLFSCVVMTIGVLVGVHHFYLNPIQVVHLEAKNQLSSDQNQYEIIAQHRDQLNALEGDSYNIQEITTQIPVGNIQPESLLTTFSDKAEQANVVIVEQRFLDDMPVVASYEETQEELQSPSLMKSTVSLTLEGETDDQFRQFIELLEETDRLIQVEAFILDQVLPINDEVAPNSEMAYRLDPVDFEGVKPEQLIKLGGPEKQGSNDSQSDSGEEEDRVDSETDTESEESSSSQQITMTATITLAVYYFES